MARENPAKVRKGRGHGRMNIGSRDEDDARCGENYISIGSEERIQC